VLPLYVSFPHDDCPAHTTNTMCRAAHYMIIVNTIPTILITHITHKHHTHTHITHTHHTHTHHTHVTHTHITHITHITHHTSHTSHTHHTPSHTHHTPSHIKPTCLHGLFRFSVVFVHIRIVCILMIHTSCIPK